MLRKIDEEKNVFSRIIQGFRGVKTTEYSLLVGFIAVLALVLFTFLGITLYDLYSTIANNVP